MLIKNELASVEAQLADCVTVYCMAGLKTLGKQSWEEVTGCFWRFSYRRDPEILFWVSLFTTPEERNSLLKHFFDIDLLHHVLVPEEYHKVILSHLRMRHHLPMIFVNRFEMPYDTLGYQKLMERHYVLVQGYDEDTDEYLLIDFFHATPYNRVARAVVQASIARSREDSQPLLVACLNGFKERFSTEQVREIMQGNLVHMMHRQDVMQHATGLRALDSLYRDIESRDGYTDEYVRMLNLFSKLKHVGNFRLQHARFLENYLGAIELAGRFVELGNQWTLVANTLLKAHLTRADKLVGKALQQLADLRAQKVEILHMYQHFV